MSATGENPDQVANYRFARAAAIILGVLIAIALAALVLGFALRSNPRSASAAGVVQSVFLSPGAHIVSMDVVPGRIVLRLRVRSGDEIDIIDTQSGHLVGRVMVPGPADDSR